MSTNRASSLLFFFFNATAITEIYTLSLHDALPIFKLASRSSVALNSSVTRPAMSCTCGKIGRAHSELQSRRELVCRLLLEKKKDNRKSLRWEGVRLRVARVCSVAESVW